MAIQEIEVKAVMTKSNLPVADFSVNPYVGCTHACKYCYASFMKRFTNHPEPWGSFVDVKMWPEIKNAKKYAGKEAFFGSVTDCYQPCEAKYKRTRALLEQLQGSGISVSISTKSDLVLRDLDLIKTFPNARVSWSINTLEEDFRKEMDRGVSIERRLEAMRQFYDAGVQTTCFISPIFPGITDVEEIILRAKDYCNLVWLDRDIYTRKDRTFWSDLDARMRSFCAEEGLPYVRNDDSRRAKHGEPPVVVNYFFHEEIIPSARKEQLRQTRTCC